MIEKEARQQQERIFILGIAIISYVMDTCWLGLFYYYSVIKSEIPLSYGISTGIICTIFFLVFRSGWNLKLRDKNLTIAQIISGYVVQLVFLYLVPQLGFLFLLNIVLVSAFGILTMSVRQFVGVWIVLAVATGFIICGKTDGINVNLAGGSQSIVFWLIFVSVLGRVIFVGMRITQLRNKLSDRNRALRVSLEQIEHLANIDGLTQILNRRAFMSIAEDEISRTRRNRGNFCLALIDIDYFKRINDKYGHLIGDEVLRDFSTAVGMTIRVTDKLARYGGEEFIVLLPETDLDGGRKLAERILNKIHQNDWRSVAMDSTITASIGIAAFKTGDSLERLIDRSDKALYRAKHSGRNCIIYN